MLVIFRSHKGTQCILILSHTEQIISPEVLKHHISQTGTRCRTCVETWHEGPESTTLKRLTPPRYRCIEAARPIPPDAATNTVDFQNHGGLAFIHRHIIQFQKRILDESIDIRCYASTPDSQFMLCIYRPGSASWTPTCFNELSTVLEQLVSCSCPVVACLLTLQRPLRPARRWKRRAP